MTVRIGVIATVISTALGFALIVNSVARLAVPRRQPLVDMMQFRYFREDLQGAKAMERQRVVEGSSKVAHAMECVLGSLLVLRLWTGPALKGLMVLFSLFSAFLVVGKLLGWPVAKCGCIAGIEHLPLGPHLVLNGCVLLLVSFLLRGPNKTRVTRASPGGDDRA